MARRMARKGACGGDVRSGDEYSPLPHPGVNHVPLDPLRQGVEGLCHDQQQPLLVYGATASQAQGAIGILRSLGYREVHNHGDFRRAGRSLAARV